MTKVWDVGEQGHDIKGRHNIVIIQPLVANRAYEVVEFLTMVPHLPVNGDIIDIKCFERW